MQYSRGQPKETITKFVKMYVNDLTVDMGKEGKRAIEKMFEMARERGIISQESNPYQYRFQEIVDPESGKLLYEIEHEVRSFTHPMYARPLVNRNPAQRQPTYQPGQDAFYPRYSN